MITLLPHPIPVNIFPVQVSVEVSLLIAYNFIYQIFVFSFLRKFLLNSRFYSFISDIAFDK